MTAVASAISAIASPAWSLGLGKLSVQSSLGEALRAEIDVTSLSADEASSLRARLATVDAYKAAGVDFNSALEGAQVMLARRPDGRAYLKIQGERSLQEPFVDVILDMSWATGRLTREYTMLIDPPARNLAAAPAPQAAPVATAPAPAAAAPRVAEAPRPPRVTAPPAPRRQPVENAPADAYRVRVGDTLSRIASANMRQGVSLDQMLVALYRNNPEAFIDNNMNRLRAGVALSLPSDAVAGQVPAAEARQVIQAQSADFDAYRQRLAGHVPTMPATASTRQATGKVQASVDDKKTSATPASPDKLTLSSGGVKASAPEARISSDAERKAADQRVAELARNVKELETLTKPGAASASAPAAASAVVAAPPPVPAASPVAPMASMPAVQVAAPPALVAPAASEPAPAKPVAAAASTPAAAPAPAQEPSGWSQWLDGPYVMPAAAALGVLLLGVGGFAYSRRKRGASSETSFMESRMQADSFFGASGGKRVDTRDAAASGSSASPSSLSYSLSQLDAIGDVDPVAEADVYLAYGRDLQAEEILKEALRSDGKRLAIRTKLLEVYAKRADAKAYESQALEVRDLTQGQGEEWARVQESGRQLDADNPLYQAGTDGLKAAPVPAEAADSQVHDDRTMPSALSRFDSGPPSELQAPRTVIEPAPVNDTRDLDLDLTANSGSGLSGIETTERMGLVGMEQTQPISLDAMLPPAAAPARGASLDFDLDAGDTLRTPLQPSGTGTEPTVPQRLDFGDLSLDLPALPTEPGGMVTQSPAGDMRVEFPEEPVADDELSRKLELADEFRRIGDLEGARDLLDEVIAKASGAMKTKAEGMLRDLE